VDEQEQVVKVQRRRSRAEAEELAAEYETSGLTREEFCRTHGLSLASLARYRKRRQAQGAVAGASRWVAVEIGDPCPAREGSAGSGLAIGLANGRRIEIGRSFDANTLVQLLELLERA
jgi:hypothetical protein